jgi:hypothetical protein
VDAKQTRSDLKQGTSKDNVNEFVFVLAKMSPSVLIGACTLSEEFASSTVVRRSKADIAQSKPDFNEIGCEIST